MFDSPEKRDFHNPRVALAAAAEVSSGLNKSRQALEGVINETSEAAQRHGHMPEAFGIPHRGEAVADPRATHLGEDALKGAEVTPIHPESTVEQPQEKAA